MKVVHLMRACVVALLTVGTLIPITTWAAEPDTYILNTSTGAPYATDAGQGFLDLVVAEAFKRIGLKGEVAVYSASKRALLNADEDVDQGVAMRIKNLEKSYPNLIRIPERVIENDFVAYSQDLDFAATGWNALMPYAVTHIHGWVVFERNLLQGQDVTTVTEPGQMFTMLEKKRVDVALYERWQGLQRAKDLGLHLHVHEPPLASVDMFMYLHKNHAHLVEPLDQALKAMKRDGTYQAIFDKTLASLRPANAKN